MSEEYRKGYEAARLQAACVMGHWLIDEDVCSEDVALSAYERLIGMEPVAE